MNLTDKGIKVLILFVLGTMCLVISGILYFMGYGHSTLAAATPHATSTTIVNVSQPVIPTAAQVAAALGCGRFHDTLSPDGIDLVRDAGICWIGKTKYGIDTFTTVQARNTWIPMYNAISTDPILKESANSVFYKAWDQTNDND